MFDRIQDWYKFNCNDYWEHSYVYSMVASDNSGWTIRINLVEPCLEELDFDQSVMGILKLNYKVGDELKVIHEDIDKDLILRAEK